MAPDRPAFSGLFRSSLFKSLLHKAKPTSNMGRSTSTADQPQDIPDPHEGLFSEIVPEQDIILSPKLFLDVIQRQRLQPGSVPAPNRNDRKLYSVDQDLEGILQLPAVEQHNDAQWQH